MQRLDHLSRATASDVTWDIAIIGGGATGSSIALDAASRGYSVVLLEQSDFGKGTSSRSTKLIHGGVRYLQRGNIRLVREALRERSLLLENANHLVHDIEFLLPCRNLWEEFFYGTGLKLYDLLALGSPLARTKMLTQQQLADRFPTLKTHSLRCGWLYHDGQFDDSRLVINLIQTAVEWRATVLNYAPVTRFLKDSLGQINGVVFSDLETEKEHKLSARCIVNAAGPFCDTVRRLDSVKTPAMLAASQGVHLVLSKDFLPGKTAVIVPKTNDGRVMFIIPWHDHLIVGTTDTPISEVTHEPTPQSDEISFLLSTAGEYLAKRPTISDVLSTYTGIRPLVKSNGNSAVTSALSRDFVIQVAPSGLLTITGGKWTTVRRMAEACVDRAAKLAGLERRPCITQNLPLHGSRTGKWVTKSSSVYGTDVVMIEQLAIEHPDFAERLHPKLPLRGAEVVWAVRKEMARTVDDVLARRTRSLILNACAAREVAPAVAQMMAKELSMDARWEREQIQQFDSIATCYTPQ